VRCSTHSCFEKCMLLVQNLGRSRNPFERICRPVTSKQGSKEDSNVVCRQRANAERIIILLILRLHKFESEPSQELRSTYTWASNRSAFVGLTNQGPRQVCIISPQHKLTCNLSHAFADPITMSDGTGIRASKICTAPHAPSL